MLRLGATAAAASMAAPALASPDLLDPAMAASAPPQAGDLFVFSDGDRQGRVVPPADLSPGGPPLLVWPMEPHRTIVRDGSRLNQILLLRLTPAGPNGEAIVAFSAICTHAGCGVSQWK